MFAAELLMPYELFKASIVDSEPSEALIAQLASDFKTSFPAAGSRFATITHLPCAFVTIDRGVIRHASRSVTLRKANAWIAPKSPVPAGSVAHSLREDGVHQIVTRELAQDIWFSDWKKGCDLWEMSRHYAKFDQTISMLWFDEEELPELSTVGHQFITYEKDGLDELTGELPWKRKR